MTTKEALHRLVDALPDDDVEAAHGLLESLAAERLHPAVRAMLTARSTTSP
jgi:hypothetical protein